MDEVNPNLYHRVRQAVHKEWDPIGVSAFTDEMGEYDGYIPALCRLLEEKPSLDQIVAYLWEMKTESIGLSGDLDSTEEFAKILHNFVVDRVT